MSGEKKNLLVLGNIGNGHRQTNKDEKKYIRRMRILLESSLSSRNLITRSKYLGIPHLVRYSGPFLKSKKEGLWQMDQMTRKLITIHKALHPSDDIELYMSRKWGRRFTCIEVCLDASIQEHKDYIKKSKEKLITTANNCSGGARGVMVIVVGNGHGDTSSNSGRDWLHFT